MSRYNVEKMKWNEKASRYIRNSSSLRVTSDYATTFRNRNILRPVYDFFDLTNGQATILDYGCGTGWTSVLLAQKARWVSAFDISSARITILQRRINDNRIERILPCVADGERLPYANEQFDVIFGKAILHHLELAKALPEIARVLKKGGKAAFCEPLGMNPLVSCFRYIKHNYIEDCKGTDKPLKYSDVPIFREYFSEVRFLSTSFLSERVPILRSLEMKLLRTMNRRFERLERLASYATILLIK